MLTRWNRQRNDLGGFRQLAGGGELSIVLVALGLDLDGISRDVQAMCVSAQRDGTVQIGGHLAWLNLTSALVNGDLQRRVFQIRQLANGVRQRQIAITFG